MQALLIVPPFGTLDRPSLGVHVVQAFARGQGHTVDIFYSNMAFAARIGEIAYMIITTFGGMSMLGERIMGLPMGSSIPDDMLDFLNAKIRRAAVARGLTADEFTLEGAHAAIDLWLEDVAEVLRSSSYDVIGISSTFEQNNGLVLLARACRRATPAVTLVAGGANCEGPMADAIKRLAPEIDIVFSGESEESFARFLSSPTGYAEQSVVYSTPKSDLNDIPCPDFSDFFQCLERWLSKSILRDGGDLRLSYETSRGCWWGQKHHCTFCGLNGGGMGYREKSPDKVIAEIERLVSETGIRQFEMTDNIMPHTYFNTLVPMLIDAGLDVEIFYEQKANISLEKILCLRAAGISRIQPGIESLNDGLLRLMKKGTSSKQNIATLRYCRSTGVFALWNILSGFPGEREEWFVETLRLVPMIAHLQPPTSIYGLNFDRFSPYYENAQSYGITNLRPNPSYVPAFPGCDYLDELAYHFVGDSTGLAIDINETLIELARKVDWWKALWGRPEEGKTPPCLEIVQLDQETFLMVDTRPLAGAKAVRQITREQASVALSFHSAESAATRWGEENSVCFRVGDGFIPLACSAPKVLQLFETVRAPDLADAPV